ncbi:MAG: Trm112 family protein [Desulfobacteraceae bacterium]|nr:Trm112 family protein [Desulfobacteraceae bacterium]
MSPTDLLNILACPVCHGELRAEGEAQRLCCPGCSLAFPVRDGIPVMLLDEAVRIAGQGPDGHDR